jgi:hypothetical protein
VGKRNFAKVSRFFIQSPHKYRVRRAALPTEEGCCVIVRAGRAVALLKVGDMVW